MILEKLIDFAGGEGKNCLLKIVHRYANCVEIASSVIAVSIFIIAPVQAANLLQNGSFENTAGTFVNSGDGFMSLNSGSTDIPGWKTTTAELAWGNNSNVDGIIAADGAFFLDLSGYHNSFPYGGMTQTINTTVGQQYTLSLSLGTYNPNFPGPISVTAIAGASEQTFTYNPSGLGSQWDSFSFDFTAASISTPITILAISGDLYIGLDNVSVEAKTQENVPEPSSILGLLSFGILGIGTQIKCKPNP